MPSTGCLGCCTGFKNKSPLFGRRAGKGAAHRIFGPGRRFRCGKNRGPWPVLSYHIAAGFAPAAPGRPAEKAAGPGWKKPRIPDCAQQKNASAGHGARAKLFSTLDCPLNSVVVRPDRSYPYRDRSARLDETFDCEFTRNSNPISARKVDSKSGYFSGSCLANRFYADITRSYFPYALEKIHGLPLKLLVAYDARQRRYTDFSFAVRGLGYVSTRFHLEEESFRKPCSEFSGQPSGRTPHPDMHLPAVPDPFGR